MAKSDYKGLCGLPLSSPSNLADSSKNDMDPSDLCVTPGSGGSSSDGNGSRSVHTSSSRRLMLSSPTGSTSADDGGSGSSSASSDVELDQSRHQANPEDSPAPNLQRLLLAPPVRSPAATEDNVVIMDGVLVDNGPGAPSNARRSVSFVDNELGNRRSACISNLLLVSSGSRGSSGGGSGSRRGGFGGQFYQRRDREEPRGTQPQRNRYYEGSSNCWQAGPSNVQFPFNHNIQQGQQLPLPYTMQQLPQQYPFHMTPPPYFSPWLAGAGTRAAYTYAPTVVTTQPAHYNYNQPGGSSGVLPVDIRRPDGTPLPLPPPPTPSRRPVAPLVISAPPASGGHTPAPERPGTQPSPPAPAPRAPTARTFSWPPTVEEESAIWYALHGTSSTRRRPRLPVFMGICSDGAEGQAPPPPPPAPPCP